MTSFHRRLIRRLRIPSVFNSATLEIAGRQFRTPKIEGAMCETDERWMVDLLGALLPLRAGAFLDVGVNLGQTLLAMNALDPARAYVGLEPNPRCVAYVEALKKANGLANCTVLPVALGSDAAIRRLEFYHGDTTDSSASLVANFRPDQELTHVILVPVFAYEDVVRATGLGAPAFVKIDVEGAESEIIQSMRGLIGRAKPWFVVEILPCYSGRNRERIDRQNKIQVLLLESGYRILRLMKRADGRLESLRPLEEIEIHGNMEWVDYVLCPQADVERIAAVLPVARAPG
jgi:FkbM family methyltransferase